MDGSYSMISGGRWNPKSSFAVVYLNATEQVARANVDRRFSLHPFSLDDVLEERLPDLVETNVSQAKFVDVISDAGCISAGFPDSYPLDAKGKEIKHEDCQPIGQEAFNAGDPGIACRCAAIPSPPYAEELAWFQRTEKRLPAISRRKFRQWYYE